MIIHFWSTWHAQLCSQEIYSIGIASPNLSLFFVSDQKLNLIVPYNLDEEINRRGNKVIYH